MNEKLNAPALARRYSGKLLRMVIGFSFIALGVVIAKQSYCLSPWNVLNDGLAYTFPITIGQANITVGMTILVINLLFLHETFGVGTVLNIWLVGVITDQLMRLNTAWDILPKIHSVPLQILFCLASLLSNALGIYFYMSARMGAGPRDTVIVFLTKHLPMPVGLCKLLLEATACLVGWLIGGEVGIGSLISVLCGGPILQQVFRLFHFNVKQLRGENISDTWQILRGKKLPPELETAAEASEN